MNPQLRTVLARLNPWLVRANEVGPAIAARLPDPLLARTGARRLQRALADPRRAHLVIGPRRAGKSTLVWLVLQGDARPVMFVNCEEPFVRE